MSKKRFVQSVVIRSLPEPGKLAQAIAYAEQLWEGLSQHGYGADKQEPREGKDWYKALSDRQRRWFDKFWIAFGHKHGRNGAAMRWHQLGELTDEQYQQIVDAAGKEAHKQLPPGQARKMAQGWLQEKRHLDYAPDRGVKQREKNQELTRLSAELNGLKRLHETGKDDALLKQIEKLEQAIRDVRAR